MKNKFNSNKENLVRTLIRLETMDLRYDEYGVLCAWERASGMEISKYDIPTTNSTKTHRSQEFRNLIFDAIRELSISDIYEVFKKKGISSRNGIQFQVKKGFSRNEFHFFFPDESYDEIFALSNLEMSKIDMLLQGMMINQGEE
jgi:hypothetical protein